MYKERLQEKLIGFSKIDAETKCWEWCGQVSNSGHGRIMIKEQLYANNKTVSAETASYIAFVNEIPEGKIVRQTCSNRLCINPKHLEIIDFPR